MRILVGDYGNVDFSQAIPMSDEDRKAFIEFMKNQFAVVEVVNDVEQRYSRLGDKFFIRKWSSKEIAVLLEIADQETTCKKLGRTDMSVTMMAGKYIPALTALAKKEGLDLVADSRELIEIYLKDQFERQKAKRDAKKAKKKEFDDLKDKVIELERKIDMQRLLLQTMNHDKDSKLMNERQLIIKELVLELETVEEKINQRDQE